MKVNLLVVNTKIDNGMFELVSIIVPNSDCILFGASELVYTCSSDSHVILMN